jgi:ankyrin repeat protein
VKIFRAILVSTVVLLLWAEVAGCSNLAYKENNGPTRSSSSSKRPEKSEDGAKLKELIAAIQEGDSNTVALLLGAGVNPNGYSGTTPLNAAAEGGRLEIVRLLIKHGASVNLKCVDERTPLMASVAYPKVVKLLLLRGAKVNTVDKVNGTTALMCAACGPSQDMLRLGLPLEASEVSAELKQERLDFFETVRLLVSHGANVNAKDKSGLTPLRYAAVGGQTEIIQYLLKHGAVNSRGGQSFQRNRE